MVSVYGKPDSWVIRPKTTRFGSWLPRDPRHREPSQKVRYQEPRTYLFSTLRSRVETFKVSVSDFLRSTDASSYEFNSSVSTLWPNHGSTLKTCKLVAQTTQQCCFDSY
ncbi:hypothetical protein SCLCIDRAFT_182872 [Scleroderma citrinum Foug A]|uniref:Uncharacterized protein n=1 Tax=Scleroderma citrinum Foug A TaxID=1036808 RepID=A0A0C3DLW5_9AGAM|nr:hypothetical protein SCLCIDRAFT_182872 [Scleroderma citrinum Foug A]